jgi:hypothetical protein
MKPLPITTTANTTQQNIQASQSTWLGVALEVGAVTSMVFISGLDRDGGFLGTQESRYSALSWGYNLAVLLLVRRLAPRYLGTYPTE